MHSHILLAMYCTARFDVDMNGTDDDAGDAEDEGSAADVHV